MVVAPAARSDHLDYADAQTAEQHDESGGDTGRVRVEWSWDVYVQAAIAGTLPEPDEATIAEAKEFDRAMEREIADAEG